MFNELEAMIHNLSDQEAKSLLHQFLFHVNIKEENPAYSDHQFFLDIKNTFHDLLEYQKQQAYEALHREFQKTHIIFGDSSTGSLRVALKKLELHEREQIISFSDLFSIGPIFHLHSEHGISNRSKWLSTHINIEEEVLFRYETKFKQTLQNVEQIPSHHPIIIWAGENAHEQTALRFALYLLKDKTNDIFIINPNEAYKTCLARKDIYFTPRHTGELSAEQLLTIYEAEKNLSALSESERKTFEQQWGQLCESKEVLRIWEDNTINSVPETFYDDYIINTAKKIQDKFNPSEFIKSARLIGEVIGHLEQYIGDQFIEYRVLRLIVDGIFDMEGVPRAMRFYSIKVR